MEMEIYLFQKTIVWQVIFIKYYCYYDWNSSFSDLLGFIISIISIYTSRKVLKNVMNYGYHRAEIIDSLVNILLIWALTIWLL